MGEHDPADRTRRNGQVRRQLHASDGELGRDGDAIWSTRGRQEFDDVVVRHLVEVLVPVADGKEVERVDETHDRVDVFVALEAAD